MKLIKINTNHYVVVDNSEVRPGDYVYTSVTNKVVKFTDPRHFSDGTYFKITHSTQPVETANEVWEDSFKRYDYITLQEIKELIGEVNVENKAQDIFEKHIGSNAELGYIPIKKEDVIDAIKEALEDNKENKYTEQDIRKAIKMSFDGSTFKEIIQSLQPKTEWEVEIVDGKLKLI